jgi:hypothetical protein
MLLQLDEFLRFLNWILLRHLEIKKPHFNVFFVAWFAHLFLLRRWSTLSFCLFIRCLLIRRWRRRYHLIRRNNGHLMIFYDLGCQIWCWLAFNNGFLIWLLLTLVDLKTLILLSLRVTDITFKRISSLAHHTTTKVFL